MSSWSGFNDAGLRRRYGFFKCRNCRRHWESSHVYCKLNSNKAVFKQDCQSCRLSFFPYKIEGIKCRYCQETSEFCQCERDDHHVDPSKPHRSDLCGKCKAGYPCDYTTALTDVGETGTAEDEYDYARAETEGYYDYDEEDDYPGEHNEVEEEEEDEEGEEEEDEEEGDEEEEGGYEFAGWEGGENPVPEDYYDAGNIHEVYEGRDENEMTEYFEDYGSATHTYTDYGQNDYVYDGYDYCNDYDYSDYSDD